MNTKVIPSIHNLGKDMWLVETPEHGGLRTLSLHLRKGGQHIWLWVKLAVGSAPKTAFPQFQRPCPALEDFDLHAKAVIPENDGALSGPITVNEETYLVNGDSLTAWGFSETPQILHVDLKSSAPLFRWE